MNTKTIRTTRRGSDFKKQMRHYLMKLSIQQLIVLAFIASISFGTVGCKAKKEARARQEALDAKIAEAKTTLLAIINDKTRSLEENEQDLERVKAMNLQDPEILDLIDRAEMAIEEQRAAEAEEKQTAEKPRTGANEDGYTRVSSLFQEVARSGNNDVANAKIRETLGLFSSTETPVLIIISQSGGQTDYDEPTTIGKYLNYLKDTRSQPAQIQNLEYDANGKIKEVELIKSY